MKPSDFIKNKLPFLYFASIALWISITAFSKGEWAGILPFLEAIGCFMIMVVDRKSLNLLMSVLVVLWSFLILFAFLSDASKLQSTDAQTWRFLIFGGLICVLNFLMAYLIVRKSVNKPSLTTGSTTAI
jgi:uncharacterized membrane protein